MALPYFFALYPKRHDFRKKKQGFEPKICVFNFNTSQIVFIVRRIKGDNNINVLQSLRKNTRYSCQFLTKLEFSQ